MNDKTSKHIDTAPQHVTTTVGIQLLWLCLVLFFGWLGWNLIVWPSTTALPWLRWSVGLVAWTVALGALALLGNTLHQAMFRKTGHTHSNDPQPPIPLEDLRLTMDPTPMFGMPWHLHIQARLSDGQGDAHPWLRVALLCAKQPLNTLQTLPSDAVVCSALLVCTPSGAASRGEVCGETELLLPQQWPSSVTEHWYMAVQDPNASDDSPPLLLNATARPSKRVPLRPAWQPDVLTQLDALLQGNEYDLLERAYSASFNDLRGGEFCVDALTRAERLAVIRVNFNDLLDHALASQWVDSVLGDGLGGSVSLFHKGGLYKVTNTESEGVFESAELRPALACYLASSRIFFTPLPGLDAVKLI